MRGDRILDRNHVARHCKPTWVDDGLPLIAAFLNDRNQAHVSVNWLEFFDVAGREAQIEQIRKAFRAKGYTLRKNGRFAVLNVGDSAVRVKQATDKVIRFIHWPEVDDPSHSGIFDYRAEDFQVALELTNLVAPGDIFPGELA